ncbi:hypothetical protein M6B38_306215 [Iris pallida]|uniref:Uncharacterized protein n=1 Tax=Iris pallida TaxID=29817 RepID=A0AAX6HK80_IRIPA|nr:hypothetical protein M6B38_306215 [Iris pallida]
MSSQLRSRLGGGDDVLNEVSVPWRWLKNRRGARLPRRRSLHGGAAVEVALYGGDLNSGEDDGGGDVGLRRRNSGRVSGDGWWCSAGMAREEREKL